MKARLAIALCALALPLFAQNTAFTYQGSLGFGGTPANGSYDFTFALYASTNSGSVALGGPITNTGLPVVNGVFTASLDFGAAFDGSARWLEIGVRTNGGNAFTTLSPRQPILPSPMALFAANANNAVAAGTAAVANTANGVAATNIVGGLALSQLPGAVVTNGASNINLTGSFAGNVSNYTLLNAARLVAKLRAGQHVTVLGIGDSMSEQGYNYTSATLQLSVLLRNWYGDGGQALDGWDVGYNPQFFLRPLPAGFFSGAVLYPGDQIRSVQYGSSAYYPFSHVGWFLPTNSFNRVGLYYYCCPQGGIFNVGVSNTYTGATIFPTQTLTSFSPAPLVAYTNWAVPESGAVGLYLTGGTATNVIVGEEMINTNSGVEIAFWAHGGIALTNLYSMGTNLLKAIFSNVAPDLVIFNNKNNAGLADGSNIPVDYSNLVSCLPPGTPVCVTLTPVATDSYAFAQSVDTNAIPFAASHGYGVLDLQGAFLGDTTLATDGFYLPDETHPSPAGALAEAEVMANELQLAPSPAFQLLPEPITSLTSYGIPGQFCLSNGTMYVCVGASQWAQASFSPGNFQPASAELTKLATGDGGDLTNLSPSLLGPVIASSLPASVVTNGQSNVALAGAFSGDGSGLQNTVTAGNYAFSMDTTAQTVAVANSFQNVAFASAPTASGWAYNGATDSFTCGKAGLYMVRYDAEIEITASSATTISMRGVDNGTEIHGSEASAILATANQPTLLSKAFLVSLGTGDILQAQLTASKTSARLVAGVGAASVQPSISLTIIRLQ